MSLLSKDSGPFCQRTKLFSLLSRESSKNTLKLLSQSAGTCMCFTTASWANKHAKWQPTLKFPIDLKNNPFHLGGVIKGSLGGETSVLRTFRMSGKELVKERVSKERVRQGKS